MLREKSGISLKIAVQGKIRKTGNHKKMGTLLIIDCPNKVKRTMAPMAA